MHHSPSLFFDILATEDEQSRDEKIKRASFEIKTAHATGSPPGSQKLPHVAVTPATANGRTEAHTAGPQQPIHSICKDPQQQDSQTQLHQLSLSPLQQRVGAGAGDVAQLVLTPQEVLQELLGDMYIDQTRLTMGDLLGQGGFADVHAAELSDPLLPSFTESVAVKRLRPDVLKSPDDLREFLTEANLLRKLQHRNIVRLRGVGATDLADLVAMRESMFVVQEFMAGGDLKALVMSAMTTPFDPPYSKPQAFTWAMQIAEAMHYLHSVCSPMIIHRDLKLDNVLLTGGNMHERVAKLADFGLHKRVRKMTSSGALVAWNQETTYHGGDYEKSFYGGKLYLVKSAMSIASSAHDDDSVYNGSMHGGSLRGGSVHGGGSWHRAAAAGAALGTVNDSAYGALSPTAAADASVSNGQTGNRGVAAAGRPPLPYRPSSAPSGLLAPGGSDAQGAGAAAAASADGGLCSEAQVTHTSDSAVSILDSNLPSDNGKQQLQEQELLQGAVRAKSQGLLAKQDFVTRVLAVPSNSSALQKGPMYEGDKEVARTLAAVQALEGSVRAGSAFYQQPQQQQQQQAQQQPQTQPQRQTSPGVSASGSKARRSGRRSGKQQSELCPQLLQELAGCHNNSQKFIEATQKVGSVMYMAPEVLTGHHYNEKIDVFSFGIILYELLSGVVLASRIAMQGQHDELLDYARQVANGHREDMPTHWPAQVRNLISACWAQQPRQRPSFKQVLKELYGMKQAGVDVTMEGLRPRGDYNPVTDCGCSIM